jgi:hypothetical protein
MTRRSRAGLSPRILESTTASIENVTRERAIELFGIESCSGIGTVGPQWREFLG